MTPSELSRSSSWAISCLCHVFGKARWQATAGATHHACMSLQRSIDPRCLHATYRQTLHLVRQVFRLMSPPRRTSSGNKDKHGGCHLGSDSTSCTTPAAQTQDRVRASNSFQHVSFAPLEAPIVPHASSQSISRTAVSACWKHLLSFPGSAQPRCRFVVPKLLAANSSKRTCLVTTLLESMEVCKSLECMYSCIGCGVANGAAARK
jgi:hypothetical protein